MSKIIRWSGLALSLATLASCGASAQQLRSRAAFDLKCPEGQIEIVPIDGRTKGVRGCGKQATYVESCKGGGANSPPYDCVWVLNSEAK